MRLLINWIHLVTAILIFSVFIQSCNSQEQSNKKQPQSQKEFNEKMINSHRQFLEGIALQIKAYTDSSGYEFKRTGTGLNYAIFENGVGVVPKVGDEVRVRYSIRFLDGEPVLKNQKPKMMDFFIEKSDVERGFHESLQLSCSRYIWWL